MTLTNAQIEAVQRFAAEHGRNWKAAMRQAWEKAIADYTIHALRNSHGPRWLETYRLPKYTAPATPRWRVGDDGSGEKNA